jgi:hypothetical protein
MIWLWIAVALLVGIAVGAAGLFLYISGEWPRRF